MTVSPYMRDKVYRFIRDYQLANGHSPSIREIGNGTGLASTSSVAWHLVQLENRGLISREAGTRGTVTVSELVTVDRQDLVTLLMVAPTSEHYSRAHQRLGEKLGMW